MLNIIYNWQGFKWLFSQERLLSARTQFSMMLFQGFLGGLMLWLLYNKWKKSKNVKLNYQLTCMLSQNSWQPATLKYANFCVAGLHFLSLSHWPKLNDETLLSTAADNLGQGLFGRADKFNWTCHLPIAGTTAVYFTTWPRAVSTLEPLKNLPAVSLGHSSELTWPGRGTSILHPSGSGTPRHAAAPSSSHQFQVNELSAKSYMQIQLIWDDFWPKPDQNCHLASIFQPGLSRPHGWGFALYPPYLPCSGIFLLNSGFRILTLSSHVLPRGIRLPFELLRHRDTDELVIIATRLILLGKKACPSDTLPVLWRGQRRDGFAGLISRLQLWCCRERRWRGFKANVQSHGIAPCPQTSNQSLQSGGFGVFCAHF